MKISDILINEAPAATGKVPPQPTLKGKPSTGPKGQAWLKKYGATHNPDGTPKSAPAPAQVAPQQGNGLTGQNAPGVAPEVGVAQASSNTTPDPVPAQEPTPAPAPAPTTPPPQANPLGVQAQAGGAFGQQTPQADVSRAPTEPAPAPAEPAPASAPATKQAPPGLSSATTAQGSSAPTGPTAQANPDGTGIGANAQVNPDTNLSTQAKPVTTASGAKTNITTASDDELAWRSKQTGMVNFSAYPGPGKWDPKTGRTKRESIEYHERDNQLLQRMRQIAGLR